MSVASRKIRSRMLMTTALAAITAMPNVAHAQLVSSGDLSSAVDSAGNPNQLTVTDTSATQTDIEVEAAVVVAEWTDFNIDMGDTVNVTIDAGLALSEATLFNRVIGANPSNMNGTLNAAGINFWLVNQNGILFGTDSTISAQSFFASTLDVANQDVFDFYEATDLFGNGTDTLNFAGVSTNAVQALGNASFVTDGSLAFVGQQLDLAGSFDAGTGRAIFVTASDVDVSFTAGSPLTYTVNAGTTVAAQSIDGSIQGASAEFAMFTAAGVVGALLDIDATVTATTAVATDTGIALLASGPSSVTVEIGGEFSSTGLVSLNSNGDLTATADISGSDLDLDATGAIGVLDLTSSDGNINANAGTTLTAGVVDTSGNGGAILTAAGNITTTSINSNEPGATNGFIDVDSTGGGTLDLGALSTDGTVALDTSGTVMTGTISALGALTIGSANTPAVATLGGDASADSINIVSLSVDTMDLTATGGDIFVSSNTITSGAVSATGGDVTLISSIPVTTTSITATEALGVGGDIDVDSTGAGTLDLGTVAADGTANFDTLGTLTLGTVDVGGALVIGALNDPFALNLNDDITAGSFTFTSMDPFVSQDITTTDGDLNISAASISTGNLDAENGGGVILTSPGNITTSSITSNEPGATNGFIDVESTGGGTLDLGALSSDGDIALDTSGIITTASITTLNDLTIGGTTTPTTVTFTGNVDADIVDITATGTVSGLGIDATDGNLDITANVIDAGNVSATGGDVILNAAGNITTTSITSNESFGGGNIDVDSTGGGTLDLGAVSGDGAANLDTTGTLTLGLVNIGGALVIGAVSMPTTLNLNGNITAGSFTFTSMDPFTSQDITTTDGDLNISAASISTGNLDAENGGGVILTSPGNITTSSITSNEPGATNGFIDVESTGGGTLDLGALSSDGDIALDTSGIITTASITTLNDLTIGGTTTPTTVTFTGNVDADIVDITATGTVSGLGIDATDGNLDITANVIDAGNVSATGGDVILNAAGNITTTSITSNESFGGGNIDVDSTGGGTLDLGAVSGDGAANLDTTGTLTLGLVNIGGALVIGAVSMPTTLNLNDDITAGSFTFTSMDPFVSQDITTTDGDLNISAASISTGNLDAENGGGVILTSPGNITTSSITSNEPGATNGFIDVESTGGGTLDLGALSSDGDIALDTSGIITTASITTLNDLTIGGTTTPTTVTFTGNVDADIVDITATGTVSGLGIDATDGNLDITANVIDAGNVSATGGDVILNAAGNITTTSITANEGLLMTGGAVTVDSTGGSLDLGTINADGAVSATALAGNVTTGDVTTQDGNIFMDAIFVTTQDLDANGGGSVRLFGQADVTTGSVTANEPGVLNGFIEIASTAGGELDLGVLTTDGDVTLDSVGQMMIDGVNALGDLTIGAGIDPSGVTFTGNVEADNVSIVSNTFVDGLDIEASDGDLTITAGSTINAGDVSATGGDAILTAPGNITTTSITANEDFLMMGGAIDVDSTLGGDLDLGDLTADGDIALDTTGALMGGNVTTGGNLLIGNTNQPSTVTFTGDLTASSFALNLTGPFAANNITATAGDVDIDAQSIAAAWVMATGGDVLLTATGDITTTSIMATAVGMVGGNIDVDSTGGGALDLGDLTADQDIALDTFGMLTANTVTGGGSVQIGAVSPISNAVFTDTVSGADVFIDAGALTAQDVTATAGTVILNGGTLSANDVSATGGNVSISPIGSATTNSITATAVGMVGGSISATGLGAPLDLGDLSATNDIALDTDDTLTVGQVTTGGALTVGTLFLPSAITIGGNVTADSVGIDGAATAALAAQDITANAGNLEINVGSIAASNLSATGGDVSLTTASNVTTASIASINAGGGGSIDVDSTGGGMLSLGDLTADNGIALDTSGSVTAAMVTAGGAFDVGSTTTPSTISLTGNVTAASVDLTATVAVATQNVTATAGLIDIDGNQQTLGALSATDDVVLDGGTFITADSITADSDTSGAGDVLIGTTTAPVTLTVTGATSGAGVDATASGTATFADVTSTSGAVSLEATAFDLTAGNVTANGGNAALIAGGNVTTTTITSAGGSIDVDSTGGGALGLGDLTSDMGIALDTSGSLTAGTVTATGALAVGQTAMPTMTTFTGNVTAGRVDIDGAAAGSLTALDLAANADDIDIDVGSVTAGDASAAGNVAIDGAGTIALTSATADSDTNGTGDLSIGTNTIPAQLDVTGTASGVNTSLHANVLNVATATATGGDLVLSGGTLTVGTAQATNDVTADAINSITADTITADSDTSGMGDVEVGLMTTPGQLTVSTSATGASVTLQAGQIDAAAISSTAGDATLNASGDITTASITSTGGSIDVDSTGGGALALGDLISDMDIALDTSGSLTANTVTATGALAVGQTAMPTTTAFTGNATAGSMDIDGAGAGTLAAQDLTATAGGIDIDVGSTTAGNVSATGSVAIDGAGTIALTNATADSDTNGTGDLSIGIGTIPAQLDVTGTASGVNTSLHADVLNVTTATATGGDLVLSGDTITVGTAQATNNVIADATDSITADTVTADSDMSGMGDVEVGLITRPSVVTINTSVTGVNVTLEADTLNVNNGLSNNGDTILRGNVINVTDVTANGGDVALEATGNVTTMSITATTGGMGGGNIDVDSTAGGALDLGDLSADAGITLDTTGTVAADEVTAGGALQVGGTAVPSSVTFTNTVTAGSIDIDTDAMGSVTGTDLAATADDIDVDTGSFTANAVAATGNLHIDGGGAITADMLTADSDGDLAGDLSIGTTTAPASIAIAGASSGANVTIRTMGTLAADAVTATNGDVDVETGDAATTSDVTASGAVAFTAGGALTTQAVTAGGGDVSLTGAAIAANTIAATGGDANLDAAGNITTNAITSTAVGMAGGSIDVDSTGGGDLGLGDVTADGDVALDSTGNLTTGQVTAGGSLNVGDTAASASATFTGNVTAGSIGVTSTGALNAQDVAATAGSIDVATSEMTAGAVAATDAITIEGAGAVDLASAAADSDANGTGDLTIGATTAPSELTVTGAVSGANVTTVSAGATTTGAVSTSGGDTSITSGGDTTIASVDTGELAIQSDGLLSIGAVDASGSAVLESADVDLQGAVDVDGASLTLRSSPGTPVGLGTGTGDYQLDDAELAQIDTGTLIVDAVDQEIEIGDVSFTGQAGANEVVLATSGPSAIIRVTGDITGTGASRLFRFGGDAATSAMLAERVIMDIENASIDFGDATFDLRAEDIAFGNQQFIDAVAGRDSGDLALNIVGDANSILFNPLLAGGIGGARIADPVYLRAGNISISYGNSALFQNTAPPAEGGTLFTAVVLGQPNAGGTLTLAPTDDTNTFAYFGQINELVGTAAALAGGNVIILGNDVRLPDSRVNGCVIGSGADCVTTIIGTTVISIPREAVSLLTADAGLLVPFDPLVGTNNEGLFSDAATAPDEDCERDENGACIAP